MESDPDPSELQPITTFPFRSSCKQTCGGLKVINPDPITRLPPPGKSEPDRTRTDAAGPPDLGPSPPAQVRPRQEFIGTRRDGPTFPAADPPPPPLCSGNAAPSARRRRSGEGTVVDHRGFPTWYRTPPASIGPLPRRPHEHLKWLSVRRRAILPQLRGG